MNDLSRNLVCIRMKSGIEIWAEAERAKELGDLLINLQNHFFARYDGQVINTAEVEGIFTAHTMDALTRRRNGEWQCGFGQWHSRKQECRCAELERRPCVKCGRADYRGYVKSSAGPVCDDCWIRR